MKTYWGSRGIIPVCLHDGPSPETKIQLATHPIKSYKFNEAIKVYMAVLLA